MSCFAMHYVVLCAALLAWPLRGAGRAEVFKVFQFPADQIPRIDGNTDDWKMVPDDYSIGVDQLVDDTHPDRKPDAKDLDVKVKVGWVKGLNRVYFLYEAYDNYWDFAEPGLHNDIFELVVDGDLSGGPLIERFQPDKELSERDAHFSMHGVHAQNYHIMTPPLGKDWALAWGCNSYVKNLPYANAAYDYRFRPGEPGRLIAEFWITPFDYAGCEGPQRAVESVLRENKLIGLSWAILDYDDPKSPAHEFWNLSRGHTMYGKADELVIFRLMPLEPPFQRLEANWSFTIVNMERRLVAFTDESTGRIASWKWSFGDGAVSTEQNPIHQYSKGGDYIVVLEVDGPEGKSRREKIWDVDLR
jgi:hypothetical protein